jgi:DNA helicase II / ATP-dependent DNA helicase PcrA
MHNQLGFSKTESRFSTKGAWSPALFTRPSTPNSCSTRCWAIALCTAWEGQLRAYDDLPLYWAQTMADPPLADDIGGNFEDAPAGTRPVWNIMKIPRVSVHVRAQPDSMIGQV